MKSTNAELASKITGHGNEFLIVYIKYVFKNTDRHLEYQECSDINLPWLN